MSLQAQQHLLSKTAVDKFKSVRQEPLSTWSDKLLKSWDPKQDFAFAMLHAERLTILMSDVAICELLHEQAKRHPKRAEIFERYIERAEPRCRFLLDQIQNTGARLLASLADTSDMSSQSTA